ncbi:MAG TPA: FG-GAP-like repeat-containing protein [Gaiellaceae bacterium]|jgi:Na+-translocating ferredoxin:NAD+ oxidoreductase RnfD subunit
MTAVAIRGTSYPVVLPKLRDPRLHLAATITSLQILGQVAFHFRLSIAQILLCLGTCAVLEVAITFRQQHVIMWPASALLTGNGVAFVLRLPNNHHGDWWSLNGWWIYVATAGGALLSKYIIKWRGEHIFNPSNIGLVVVFLALGRTRVEPLDFWWGPMSWWMALALIIIVSGGFLILQRLKLLRVALSFWAAFAVGIGGLALAGHVMTARWHLGPITGLYFWWVLVTSPEVLVFLFFMITDPKTAPKGLQARVAYGIGLGVLAAMLIAPTRSEFAAKVGLLSALAIFCVVRAAFETFPIRIDRRRVIAVAAVGAAAYVAVAVGASSSVSSVSASSIPTGQLPSITILPSPGVQTGLDRATAEVIAHDLAAVQTIDQPLQLHLVPGTDQGPPIAVAQSGGRTYRLSLGTGGIWTLANAPTAPAQLALPSSNALADEKLTDVAGAVGLNFRQGSFRFGVSNDYESMMGGGVCWLDYNNDGWQDLFAVNSYSSSDTQSWQAHGGLPTSQLFENVHGVFANVSAKTHANLAAQGDGCVAADLNGDGNTDLVVTTTQGVQILWNNGGSFSEQTLKAAGWYTGAAVADVNGDGRPDIFVAGYSVPNDPVPNSIAGFPTNLVGVRDLLYLNEGNGAFREVGVQAGIEAAHFRHGLGAEFVDVNHDGRPDLYVANDEDPNQLYVNVPWPGGAAADPLGLGFRFEERASDAGIADPFAGMGIASTADSLFVTNSRGEPSAVYAQTGTSFTNARPTIDPALGDGFAGWGASWVDLANSGEPDLVLTAGAIPVKSLTKDAEPLRVLAPKGSGDFGVAKNVLPSLKLNGRGLAAADVDNNGRVQVAVGTIGGKLALLRSSGASGHWLDVALSRFAPGAVVTADGVSRVIAAGSSYLSSEDPRAHFGLGAKTVVHTLTVRYPYGGETVLHNVHADQVLEVKAPAPAVVQSETALSPELNGCKSALSVSVATYWDAAAVDALRAGNASEPVQARDLYDVSLAMYDAWKATKSEQAVSYAAYRVLLSQASYNANLATSFALLTRQLRDLCLSPYFVSTSGNSPAAAGNRVAAAVIAAGRNDGSNEVLHYADPSYTPTNAPLILAQYGSTVHDPTFWQPLALTQIAPKGVSGLPGDIQTFVDSQWGHVKTFAGRASIPKSQFSKAAALAVIRATAAGGPPASDTSPLAWNTFATSHASGTLAGDIRLYLTLNGALNDTAVSVWAAKRAYQAPRPISMIRYLAFNNELPVTPGLVEQKDGKTYVRERGKWVLGGSWTPPFATPASPGGVSEHAAFAAAAEQVLGRSRTIASGVALGIDTPSDEAAGRAVGAKAGALALARARTLFAKP